MIVTFGGYDLDDSPARVDDDAAWHFLSAHAYWGRTRTRDDFAAQLESAWRVVGVYQADSGRMVGFARAVSDGVAFAYLADVYVLHEHRGQGLGKELVRTMIDRGPGSDFRWTLHTSDAHGLYQQFGFGLPDHRYLERPARESAPDGGIGGLAVAGGEGGYLGGDDHDGHQLPGGIRGPPRPDRAAEL